MGVFSHEAAAADPDGQTIYLTEDKPDGALYRFTPDTWGDLSTGRLDAMIERDGVISWQAVPDPGARDEETRRQLADVRQFDGGEGAWFGGWLPLLHHQGR